MFKFIKLLKEEWNKPTPQDPIQEGMKVMYLGVEWTVTRRFFVDLSCCSFTISRITKEDRLESASPPYWSKLVRPAGTALTHEAMV